MCYFIMNIIMAILSVCHSVNIFLRNSQQNQPTSHSQLFPSDRNEPSLGSRPSSAIGSPLLIEMNLSIRHMNDEPENRGKRQYQLSMQLNLYPHFSIGEIPTYPFPDLICPSIAPVTPSFGTMAMLDCTLLRSLPDLQLSKKS